MREERASENGGMGSWQGESVSHCLSSLSLRDQVSLIEKKMLKELQAKCTQILVCSMYLICDVILYLSVFQLFQAPRFTYKGLGKQTTHSQIILFGYNNSSYKSSWWSCVQ